MLEEIRRKITDLKREAEKLRTLKSDCDTLRKFRLSLLSKQERAYD